MGNTTCYGEDYSDDLGVCQACDLRDGCKVLFERNRYARAWKWLAAHPECVLTSWGTDGDGNPLWRVHDANDMNGCPGPDATYWPTPLEAVEVEAILDEVIL